MPDPRKKLHRREVPGGIRYLTCSCYRRLPLLGRGRIRDVLSAAIGAARERCGFRSSLG